MELTRRPRRAPSVGQASPSAEATSPWDTLGDVGDEPEDRRSLVDAETQRLLRFLEAAVRLSGQSNRQIERALGYSVSILHRIFSSRVELKLRHLIDILLHLGVSPRSFFMAAYQVDDPGEQTIDQLVGALGRSGLVLTTGAAGEQDPVVRQIEAIVETVLARRSKEKKPEE
jgi:hypothetical protein